MIATTTVMLGSTAGRILLQVLLVLALLGGAVGVGVLIRRRLGDHWRELAARLGMTFDGTHLGGERAGRRVSVTIEQRPALHGPRVAVAISVTPSATAPGDPAAAEAAGWRRDGATWRRELAGLEPSALETVLAEAAALPGVTAAQPNIYEAETDATG